jgi:hypothetical protein
MHQVEVEIVEAGGARHVGGADGFIAVVDAPERPQLGGLEALHANRQPIDAEAAVVAEFRLLEGARVGFQGDLDVIGEPDPLPHAFEDSFQRAGGEQARRAATEKDRRQPAALYLLQIGIQVRQQRVDISVFGQRGAGSMGVEVAVRAFAHAPGDVNVGRQWRQFQMRYRRRFRSAAVGGCGHAIPRRCLSRAMARARWLSWFLSFGASSALEQSRSGTQNRGS